MGPPMGPPWGGAMGPPWGKLLRGMFAVHEARGTRSRGVEVR